MPVTVVTRENSNHHPAQGDYHASAHHFFERDGGHLVVVDDANMTETIAIHKPGLWLYAYAGEKLARRTGSKAFLAEVPTDR